MEHYTLLVKYPNAEKANKHAPDIEFELNRLRTKVIDDGGDAELQVLRMFEDEKIEA